MIDHYDPSNRGILREHFKSVDCDAIDVRTTLAKSPAHKRKELPEHSD